jgi:cyclophilin family peptidyl-prolyl cis-trans isomerase
VVPTARQQATVLLAKAETQHAAKRLTTPAGDNALESYQEVLQLIPDHTAALAGLQRIKGQYLQWAKAAQQRGDWPKAQGHYEKALVVDPSDATVQSALAEVKTARKGQAALAGRYAVTVPTPILKAPAAGAAVIRRLAPGVKVNVVSAVGAYYQVRSRQGNPPGYIARQHVARVSQDSTGQTSQTAFKNAETRAVAKQARVSLRSQVLLSTSMGNIKIELYKKEAPESVKNFLSYVNDGFFDGTIFHRVIPGFMVQGGGFTSEMQQKRTKSPIKNEASNRLKNEVGTLAMARTNVADSAMSQFFINVKDNNFLNHKDEANFGYCVFGKVTQGMDVVHQIEHVQTSRRGNHSEVPVVPVLIKSMRRLSR